MGSMAKVVPLAMAAMLAGCGNERGDVDIDEVDLDLRIGRLDRALFDPSGDLDAAAISAMELEFGGFFRTYVEEILHAAPLDDPRLPLVLSRFATDPDWSAAQEAADTVLGDLDRQRVMIRDAFRRMKVFFPDSLVPRVIAFNSGFNYGIYPTDSVLGVGVEWFIGRHQPVVGHLAPEDFPQYVKDRMEPEMLVPSAMKGWLMVHYLRDTRGADLLTHLVETGKAMALLDALLPDVHDTLKLAFTGAQLAWCEANEFAMWKELVGREMLFGKAAADIGRIMNDGPFTNGFPRESPGHVGEWIGRRMVMNYLDAHPDATFAELFALADPEEILKNYKPR